MGEAKRRGIVGDIKRAFAFLSQAWRSTDRPFRRAILGMWAIGLVSTVLGILGDETGFWSTRPFATNLMTSVTAFFFAVPVALLVLQNVQHRIAERAPRLAAIVLLEDATRALASLLDGVNPSTWPADGIVEWVNPEALREARRRVYGDMRSRGFSEEELPLAWGIEKTQPILTRLREVIRPQFMKAGLEWHLDDELERLDEAVVLAARLPLDNPDALVELHTSIKLFVSMARAVLSDLRSRT